MGFNHFARKVRDPQLPAWRRFSALRSCISSVSWCTGRSYTESLVRFGVPAERSGFTGPPSDEWLLGLLAQVEVERNGFLERRRAFDQKRIRAKLRGRRQLSNAEREVLELMRRPAADPAEASTANLTRA